MSFTEHAFNLLLLSIRLSIQSVHTPHAQFVKRVQILTCTNAHSHTIDKTHKCPHTKIHIKCSRTYKYLNAWMHKCSLTYKYNDSKPNNSHVYVNLERTNLHAHTNAQMHKCSLSYTNTIIWSQIILIRLLIYSAPICTCTPVLTVLNSMIRSHQSHVLQCTNITFAPVSYVNQTISWVSISRLTCVSISNSI